MRDFRAASAGLRREAERIPLKWRLALASFGLLAVLMAALGAVVTFTQQRAMYQNQANALYQEVSVAFGHQVGTDPYNLVNQLTSAETRATIIGADGSTVTDPNDPVEPALVLPRAPVIQRALALASANQGPPNGQQSDVPYYIVTDSSGVRQLVILVPLSESTGQGSPPQAVVLVLSTPTTAIDRAVAATRLTLTIGILIALLFAAALTFPLMSAALRPLVSMERASRRIAAGELSLRLEEPPTDDEIGRLARAFNSMVAQLEASFKRQKQFVGDVSHELRTPLTALGGGLEMLLMGADRGDPAATRRLLRSQYAEVERMQRLVEDLLTLARLDEGHTVLRIETLEVAPLLNDVADEAERFTRGQELRREIGADLPSARVDGDRLRQVLLALLDNAVKYAPAPATITLAAERAPNGGLRLEVRDTGQGIPPEDLPHVFERFYRVDPSRERSTAQGGSGLGLAIAKSLIEAQGGTVSIASTPGTGTTVIIQFPPVPAALPLPKQPSEPADGTPSPAAAGGQHLP